MATATTHPDLDEADAIEAAAQWGDAVDPRGWKFSADSASTGYGSVWLWNETDAREEGRNRPAIEDETDLRTMQALARWICEANPYGVGAISNLTNFVVGSGFSYKVGTKKKRSCPDGLIPAVQDVIDECLDAHDWIGDFERELFRRSHRDGEYILRITPTRDGRCKLRAIEPEYLVRPTDVRFAEEWAERRCPALRGAGPFSWTFGIQTPADDVVEVLGYNVEWSPGRSDFEWYPASQIEHVKCNVDRTIKRGMSDFFPTQKWFDKVLGLLGGTIGGATVQSKIALITQYEAGASSSGVQSLTQSQSDGTIRRPNANGGVKTVETRRFEDGTILHAPAGRTYTAGPLGGGQNDIYVQVLQAGLRAIAARWSMPEHVISADASNNNYASILEAGSPFRKAIDAAQAFHIARHQRLFWKVLLVAFNAGRFDRFGLTWREFQYVVELQITAPSPETRDRTQETARRATLHQAGILSLKTWAAQEGEDYEQEVASGARPAIALPGAATADAAAQIAGVAGEAATTVQDTALNGAQIDSLLSIVSQVSLGQIPLAAARPILMSAFPLMASAKIDAILAPLAGFRPATLPDGSPNPAAAPAAPQSAEQQDAGAGAFRDLSRLQFKRNIASLDDIRRKMVDGLMTEAVARVALASLGFSPAQVDKIVADAADGAIDDPAPEPANAAESAPISRQEIVDALARQVWEAYP